VSHGGGGENIRGRHANASLQRSGTKEHDMNQMPSVIVKKGGFLSSLATGFFTFLTTAVVCGSGLTFYWFHIADKHLGQAFSAGGDLIASLPQWRENLPPALADAVTDRRDPQYRESVEITARLIEPARKGATRVLIEIENKGPEVISLMALNVRVKDASGLPIDRFVAYAATPLSVDPDQWPGAILPGSKREIVRTLHDGRDAHSIGVEVTELRIAGEAASSVKVAATEPRP
jgi:hypothetical protein